MRYAYPLLKSLLSRQGREDSRSLSVSYSPAYSISPGRDERRLGSQVDACKGGVALPGAESGGLGEETPQNTVCNIESSMRRRVETIEGSRAIMSVGQISARGERGIETPIRTAKFIVE